jgi:hypothetical protein
MSFRRFLYLAADDCPNRSYSLRRIDVSRLFFRTPTEGTPAPLDYRGGAGAAAADPSEVEDGGPLPDPAIILTPSHPEHTIRGMEFGLFKDKDKSADEATAKVVSIDNKGYCLMVNPELSPAAVQLMPSVTSSKFRPFSLTVGQSHYVMDAVPEALSRKQHSFEVLSNYARGSSRFVDWCWQPLDPPPTVHSSVHRGHIIDSYAVVGSNIIVSNKASTLSYCFNTVEKKWNEAGNWVLPFNRFAEYVPEQKLWFGISPSEDSYRFSGANLLASSYLDEVGLPKVHGFWKEYSEPPPEWTLVGSYAVHLGSSKFCIARLFEIGKIYVCPESHHSYKREEELQIVLTGVDVESRDEGLSALKHKSARYKLDVRGDYWVI